VAQSVLQGCLRAPVSDRPRNLRSCSPMSKLAVIATVTVVQCLAGCGVITDLRSQATNGRLMNIQVHKCLN
jgi:hypothetical protein